MTVALRVQGIPATARQTLTRASEKREREAPLQSAALGRMYLAYSATQDGRLRVVGTDRMEREGKVVVVVVETQGPAGEARGAAAVAVEKRGEVEVAAARPLGCW